MFSAKIAGIIFGPGCPQHPQYILRIHLFNTRYWRREIKAEDWENISYLVLVNKCEFMFEPIGSFPPNIRILFPVQWDKTIGQEGTNDIRIIVDSVSACLASNKVFSLDILWRGSSRGSLKVLILFLAEKSFINFSNKPFLEIWHQTCWSYVGLSRRAYTEDSEIQSLHFLFKRCFLCSGASNMMIQNHVCLVRSPPPRQASSYSTINRVMWGINSNF